MTSPHIKQEESDDGESSEVFHLALETEDRDTTRPETDDVSSEELPGDVKLELELGIDLLEDLLEDLELIIGRDHALDDGVNNRPTRIRHRESDLIKSEDEKLGSNKRRRLSLSSPEIKLESEMSDEIEESGSESGSENESDESESDESEYESEYDSHSRVKEEDTDDLSEISYEGDDRTDVKEEEEGFVSNATKEEEEEEEDREDEKYEENYHNRDPEEEQPAELIESEVPVESATASKYTARRLSQSPDLEVLDFDELPPFTPSSDDEISESPLTTQATNDEVSDSPLPTQTGSNASESPQFPQVESSNVISNDKPDSSDGDLSHKEADSSESEVSDNELSDHSPEIIPDPITISTADGPKYNKRVFKGNPNYVSFFNREVEAFFNNDNYLPPCRTRLTQSKVGNSGMVYRLSLLGKYLDTEIERIYRDDIPGTVWSGDEKETFFNALTRYSIHNFDEIKHRLPNKSAIEIMNYYNLLKFELNHLKRKSKKMKYKVKINSSKFRFFRRLRHFKKSIKIDDIPSAYEMSEEFINFEEVQANLINKRETILQTDSNRFYKKSFDNYTKDEEHNLIDVDACSSLSELFYVKNKLMKDDIHNPFLSPGAKLVPTLNLKSLVFFEELTKLITEKIVLSLIETKSRQLFIGISTDGLSLPAKLVVTKYDISQTVNRLKLFETPKSGYLSTANDGKCGKLRYYWKNLANSLNLRNEVESKAQPRVKDFIKLIPHFKITDEFLIDPRESQLSDGPIDITELNEEKEKYNYRDDHIELKLTELECQRLEAKDSLESRKYEYVLLTLLMTFDQQDETVQRSMFTEEEIMNLVLAGWFDVVKLDPEVEKAAPPQESLPSRRFNNATETFRHLGVDDSDPSEDDSDDGVVDRTVPLDPITIRTTPVYNVEIDNVVTTTYASHFPGYED